MGSDTPPRVERALKALLRGLREAYGDAEVYLFGSFARGDWLEDSDVDIVVVSKGFEGKSMPKRVGEVRNLAPEDTAFEILAYTPQELRKVVERSVAIQDAKTYWKSITYPCTSSLSRRYNAYAVIPEWSVSQDQNPISYVGISNSSIGVCTISFYVLCSNL
ncbi:MAG: nucleotidyltransferase domain-containing protein, partial [Candidatus Bathyarchaeia archaeon]